MTDRRWFWSLVMLGVAARAAAVLALQSHLVPRSTFEHGEIAANLLAGRGFSVQFLGADGPTSQQAPAYPLLVAASYAIGGVETPRALLLLELGQALLGGWLVAEVMRPGRKLGNVAPGRAWVAVAGGLIVAVHPTLVYAATHVQVAGLAAILLVATPGAGLRKRATIAGCVSVVGLWLAALMLTATRSWVWSSPGRSAGGRGGSAGLPRQPGRLIGWTLRPDPRHLPVGRPATRSSTASSSGSRARSDTPSGRGNWKPAELGTDFIGHRASVESALNRDAGSLRDLNETLWAARHEAGYIDDIALTKADYRILGSVSEPERSRILLRRALHEPAAGRYLSPGLRRLRYFVLFDETNPKTRNRLYRLGHLGLTAIALLGLVFAPGDVRRRLGPTVLTVGLPWRSTR